MTETKPIPAPANPINHIAKIDASGELAAFAYAADHPAMALWLAPGTGLLNRLQTHLQRQGIHPAQTVVVVPYAQLRPLVSRLWARSQGAGFAPRFETTTSWCAAMGGVVLSDMDMHFDMATDLRTAQALLEQAGLGAQRASLAALLVQSAHQLGALAAARAPQARPQWAQAMRQAIALGMGASVLGWEAAVARIALEWAAVSAYATDLLFAPNLPDTVQHIVMVQGLQADPLCEGVAAHWGPSLMSYLRLAHEDCPTPSAMQAAQIALHSCRDAEDEAARCAARAIVLINQGTFPVALVSSDRLLTRRVRAMLEHAGVQMRDENGWKLSTSVAAAALMAMLRSAGWSASTDAALNWLKAVPDFCAHTDALEAALRRDQVRDWKDAARAPTVRKQLELQQAVEAINGVRQMLGGRHALPQWLGLLEAAAQQCGLLARLQADPAGQKVLQALHLSPQEQAQASPLLPLALWGSGAVQPTLDLGEFTQWVNQSLEAASFQPDYPQAEQLVILPMSQMLGRPFAAVLLAGCDEVRMSASVEPPGVWTVAQREALGLPQREALTQAARQAWLRALQTPVCDVFWRTSDETGETLLPTALVQMLQASRSTQAAAMEPRITLHLQPQAVHAPEPTAPALTPQHLSQSSYEDLRNCPYRFFAMRQLELQRVDELESEVDKRDFGLWLHDVLKRFHEQLAQHASADRAARQVMLDQASAAATQEAGLPEGEFLPFSAAWPAVREHYLDWLQAHEKTGAHFAQAEAAHSQMVDGVRLLGRIDRMDALPDGSTLVLDYKTEHSTKTSARVKTPMEDTQMAFYAALVPSDKVRGMYLAIGEREPVKAVEQEHILQARDAMLQGMQHDLQRIRAGAVLQALGEGSACEFCHARGLCRKDFWEAA